ncbi:MAG: lamin tail domain-containing protein [Candidatus Hydrogenedentes bacterium]|nr:lamin tail domain-containing protein [Candidatus Hydrogenedentota bacterium]
MSRMFKGPGRLAERQRAQTSETGKSDFGFWILDFGLRRARVAGAPGFFGSFRSYMSFEGAKGPIGRKGPEGHAAVSGRRGPLLEGPQSKIQNPKSKIRCAFPQGEGLAESSGAALIISVAIFAVLLFIGLTFWSSSRIEHSAAVRHQEGYRAELLASAGQALAVSHLRLDKKWHPTYTSIDHGWNTVFNGAWLAGKPWAFKPDAFGTRVLDRTWTSWAGGTPYKRIPYIDYWADVKLQEAELDLLIQRALFVDGIDGIDNDGDGNIDEADEIRESLGSALAQIKNPLFVPRFQIDPDDLDDPSIRALLDQQYAFATTGDPGDSDFLAAFDFPVQYAYNFTSFDTAFDDPLNIPDADYDPFAAGWPARVVTPQQKINAWADVDSDGDGLRDAMWIPIGVEEFFGGIDRNGDGRVSADKVGAIGDEGGDGIDNDLDGEVDEPDETAVFVYWGGNDDLDNDQDGQIDEADEQRVFLTAPLIADSYWGGNDGEDNDHDGQIDEPDEQRIFLTSDDRINNNALNPRVPANLPIITPAEGIDYQDPGESIPLLDTFHVRVNLQTLNEYIAGSGITITSETDSRLQLVDPGNPFGPAVDRIDNDFTQIVNDTHGHVFLEPGVPQYDNTGNLNFPWDQPGVIPAAQENRARSYSRINIDPTDLRSYSAALSDLVLPFASIPGHVPVITCAGETVCTIAGRVAVHVVDEASKVNLNTAGAMTVATVQDVETSTATGRFTYLRNAELLTFARNEGVSTGEYDTRVLPDIGVQRAVDIFMTRNGAHKDDPGGGKPQNFPPILPIDATDFLTHFNDNDSDGDGTNDNAAEAGYAYDEYFPGFGRTDDNANVLQLQFNGIDDDGDGAYYTHDGIDNDNDGVADEADEARFGIDEPFEGIDEPQELQMFRPYRNRLAELDGIDNDNDGVIDEIGELGDRLYSTGDEMAGALSSVAEMAPLRAVLTVQSSDPNARYQHYIGGAQGDLARNISPDTAPITGMKLDYNHATPDAIANALREDWSYPAFHDVLKTEMVYPADPTQAAFAGNPYLFSESGYAPTTTPAAYINDFRFQAAYFAGLRRESVSVIGAPAGIVDTRVEAPQSALALTPGRIFEADAGLRAYQLALNIVDSRDTDRVRNSLTYRLGDDWWNTLVGPAAPQREISYTLAGVEGIRINEMMVRAVRRVEAESNYDPDPVGDPRPENNPNVFSEGPIDFDVVTTTIEDRAGTVTNQDGSIPWEYFPQPLNLGDDRVGLGQLAGFQTDSSTVTISGATYDNVIQFRIGPSAQLPPGRYYLLVNTIDEIGYASVDDPTDIDFRVKYGLDRNIPGNPDILDDVIAGGAPGSPPFDGLVAAATISEPQVGRRSGASPLDPNVSPASGMVFLPTIDTRAAVVPPPGFEAYAGIGVETQLQSEAYTVIVPPFAANAADQFYLHIGIRNPVPGQTLAINFLDFSQEPDHEWVELVNVSASPDPIDLSDWLLEVGGGSNDPTRAVYRIPAGTQIAPNGSLLLTTNKYDVGPLAFAAPGARIFSANGMGMASQPASVAAPFGTASVGISEPPIPRYATRGEIGFIGQPLLGANLWNGRWGEPLGSGGLLAESIFQRPTGGLLDFLDLDGDGLSDPGIRTDDLVISTIDNPATDTPTKAWDRIVQIEPAAASPLSFINDALTPAGERLAFVATMVLRGGIFPNYPENDFVDNDGDNPELMRDGIDNDGDRLLLDRDLDINGLPIDNDGDGIANEGNDSIDNDGDGLIDEADESEGTDEPIDPRYDYDGINNDGDPFTDEGADGIDNDGDGLTDEYDESEGFGIPEGVDEGGVARWLKYDRGVGLGPIGIGLGPLTQVSGSYHRTPQFVLYPGEPAWVEGTNAAPEWKEFTERRMFPGDAVRVTLYERFPDEEFVVDRVTYTQNDVENRAPDDVRSFPVAAPDALLDRFVMLNAVTGLGLERAWPENTMGVDFYRSLERKHPLYTGDRFGLANRWTATDGNYDDWAPGTNRWFWDNVNDVAMPMTSAFVFGPTGAPTAVSGIQFFAHGFSGSPLRPNFFARVLSDSRLGYSPDPPVRLAANDAPVVPDALVGDNQRVLLRGRVRDANFRSPGDLLTTPYLALSRTYTIGEYDVVGREALQGPTVAPEDMLVGPVPPHLKGASIGTAYPEDLRALIDTASFDSIVLNVGQADFYPLFPLMASLTGGGLAELAQWAPIPDAANPTDYRAPQAWAPVFLASLDPNGSEPEGADFATMQTITITQSGTPPQYPNMLPWPGYPIQLAFLYRNVDLSVVPPYGNTRWLLQDNVGGAGSLASVRWPLERRAMMYVSSNPDAFRPDQTSHNIVPGGPGAPAAGAYPSEALFVWDGADGLPNGEYDLYVVTMPDMTYLEESTRAFDATRNDWLPAKLDRVRRRLPIDIQVLTDKDGDRKCWVDGTGPTANMPDTEELGLNTQSTGPADQREKFPLKAGLVPASDGTVHYGVVKIENNFLGVFVRNWADGRNPENVNAISRVVLMSRDRTPGRVNLNTAITQPLAANLSGAPDFNAFNPLTGLIGFTAEYVPDTNPLSDLGAFTPAPWSDQIPVATGPPYAFTFGEYGAVLARANQVIGQPPFALAVANPGFLPRGERFVDYNSDGLPDPPIDISGDGRADLAVRFDGRYLLSPAELIVSGDEAAFTSRPMSLMPSLIPQYFDVAAPTANQKAQQFDEAMERYTRMGNSITAASDTFEIIVTAQTGYAFDANRDGVINWRVDSEFVATGEKKLRTVYER